MLQAGIRGFLAPCSSISIPISNPPLHLTPSVLPWRAVPAGLPTGHLRGKLGTLLEGLGTMEHLWAHPNALPVRLETEETPKSGLGGVLQRCDRVTSEHPLPMGRG